VSLDQLKVMSAIESCRTAALGGHVLRCENCAHTLIAYNSCRNRQPRKIFATSSDEFIRRFLLHVLPAGFHRIRYYGLLASGVRAANIARARNMLALPLIPIEAIKAATAKPDQPKTPQHPCPCCGGRMVIIIETFQRGCSPTYQPAPPTSEIRIDTS
jgi:hypothetical protein